MTDPKSDNLLDPWLHAGLKGFPSQQAPLRASAVAQAGWNVLAGDLPLPVALIKRDALEHNLAWMQQRVRDWGIDLAPHGKTTMAPRLFRRQLDAGAWGITFATVTQAAVGVAAGARRCLIANQVLSDADLATLQALLARHPGLRVVFLVDSLAQLALIEAWHTAHPGTPTFEVMLEVGVDGGRTGCRTHAQALALALALHASTAVRLVGIDVQDPGRDAQAAMQALRAADFTTVQLAVSYRCPPAVTALARTLRDADLPAPEPAADLPPDDDRLLQQFVDDIGGGAVAGQHADLFQCR